MWDKCQRLPVRADHAIVISKANRPGSWFSAGRAFLTPLFRKRPLLLERSKWLYAWTLFTDAAPPDGWAMPPVDTRSLLFAVEIHARNPTGWYFTIPDELRNKGWLPSAGGVLMYEHSDSEANFWTEAAYNEETVLEAGFD